MNYEKIYKQLCEHRKNNPHPTGVYTERHRILPGCMGGRYTDDNIVRLSGREHYIAHALLWKAHRTSKLAHAWYMMCRVSENQERHITARQYDVAKNAHIEVMRRDYSGENNPFYGKKHSDETRQIISEKTKIQMAEMSDEAKEKKLSRFMETCAHLPATDKQKEAASRSSRGKIVLKNVNTGKTIKVDKADKKLYDDSIWKNPAAISQRKEKCIYCGIESVAGNIKRWHNENCKYKETK